MSRRDTDPIAVVVNAVAHNPLGRAIYQDRSPFKREALNKILNQNRLIKLLVNAQDQDDLHLNRESILELLELGLDIAENKNLVLKNG